MTPISCAEVRRLLDEPPAALDAALSTNPSLSEHLKRCDACWEHWAEVLEPAIPAVPLPWRTGLAALHPGDDAAAVADAWNALPVFEQAAGEEPVTVDGIALRVSPAHEKRDDPKWDTISIDVSGSKDLAGKLLLGLWPKQSERPLPAWIAPFTLLKQSCTCRATVQLRKGKHGIDSTAKKASGDTANETTKRSGVELLSLYGLRLIDNPLERGLRSS